MFCVSGRFATAVGGVTSVNRAGTSLFAQNEDQAAGVGFSSVPDAIPSFLLQTGTSRTADSRKESDENCRDGLATEITPVDIEGGFQVPSESFEKIAVLVREKCACCEWPRQHDVRS